MSTTIEKRIRRTVLGAILITFIVTVASVIVANENLEDSLLELDFQTERELVLENARPGETLVWDTATLKAFYAPPGVEPDARLPSIFHGFPTPFSGEIEIDGATFLITIGLVRGGHFYLAKDISIFESKETAFHQFLLVLGLAIVLFGLVLAHITSRRLVAPIQQLTKQIQQTAPAPRMPRVPSDYKDAELAEIARSFNMFLGELEKYVKREQSLMGLASHELRTPIAVIAGALDVIEQRGILREADKAPLARIRRAVEEMTANINVILKLTRRKSTSEKKERIALSDLVYEVKNDLSRHNTNIANRIQVIELAQAQVTEDRTLVKMLIRNLVQNAVQHTEGNVTLSIDSDTIEIKDEGSGLPEAYLAYLNDPQAQAGELLSLSGLGLFIVTLICERLSWKLQASASQPRGTTMHISFLATP